MDFASIGKNMRKYRLAKKFRQEDLAEKAELSVNYVGALERGEKIPSLEAFIRIANVLGVSADMLLLDVIDTGYVIKNSMIAEKMKNLSAKDRSRINDVINVLLKHADYTK